jgi:AraC-like DNA-binding protein
MDASDQITFLRSSCLPDTEFLCAARCTALFNVVHENFEVCMDYRVNMKGRYGGRPVQAQGSGLHFLVPGEAQVMTEVREPQDFTVLFVAPGLLQAVAEEHGLKGPVHFPLATALVQCPELQLALEGLLGAVRRQAPVLEQQSRLALCLHGMLEHSERNLGPPKCTGAGAAVRQVAAHLRERYREPVSLDELASLTGLSGYYLVHAFRERMGLPPHAFLTGVRLERARALLLRGLPPAAVATEVGFADQSHLNRHFKQAWHITPGQYAARAQPGPAGAGQRFLLARATAG